MKRRTMFSNAFCSRRLKAISDPTRWGILVQLLAGPKNVTELNAVLKTEPTLLSHHLRTLREEGFVDVIPEGKNRRYRLNRSIESTPSGRSIDLGCCRLELDKSFPH
jgi:ArsR family transcriptional regulator